VVETGRIVMQGSCEELRTHPRVQEAYLGRVRDHQETGSRPTGPTTNEPTGETP